MTLISPHHPNEQAVQILRSNIEHQNGYRYSVSQYSISDCCGRVTLIFRDVASFEHQSFHRTNNVYQECISRGLSPHDLIGHIRMFYPNGDKASECCMRNGIGSKVLGVIISDTRDKNGKLLYVLPTTRYMENFVVKHSFTRCDIFREQYFLGF